MAGRPRGNSARDQWLRVRITPEGKAVANKARGALSMSDYVRGLIASDAKRKGVS